MKTLPISLDARTAATHQAELALTRAEAERRIGAAVSLAVEELPGRFETPQAAERAYPALYIDPRFALAWRDGGHRVLVRFWRPIPAAPVAKSARLAGRAPLGLARSRAEAEALLGGPAELVEQPLASYATRARAEAARTKLAQPASARLQEREGRFELVLQHWRPEPAGPSVAERAAAPLRPRAPQASPYVGLFESLAPENPAVILADEGDGRPADC